MFKYLFFITLIICFLLKIYIFSTNKSVVYDFDMEVNENIDEFSLNKSDEENLADNEEKLIDKEYLESLKEFKNIINKIDRIDFIYLKPMISFNSLKFNKNKIELKLIDDKFTCRNFEKIKFKEFFNQREKFTNPDCMDDSLLYLFAYECYVDGNCICTVIPNLSGGYLYIKGGDALVDMVYLTQESLNNIIRFSFTNLILMKMSNDVNYELKK